MAVIGSGSSGRGGAPGGGTIIIRGTWKLTQEKNGLGERTNRRTKKERKAKKSPPRVRQDQDWRNVTALRPDPQEECCVLRAGEEQDRWHQAATSQGVLPAPAAKSLPVTERREGERGRRHRRPRGVLRPQRCYNESVSLAHPGTQS